MMIVIVTAINSDSIIDKKDDEQNKYKTCLNWTHVNIS